MDKVNVVKSWEEFIGSITNAEFMEIILNHEHFVADGFIGDCLMRKKAIEWADNINTHFSATIMNDLALAAYKHMFKYYHTLSLNLANK